MENKKVSLQKLLNVLLILVISVYILIIAKDIIVPFAFAVLFAFLLKPLSSWIEKWLSWRVGSIVLTFLMASIPIFIIIAIMSGQFTNIYETLPSIGGKIQTGFSNALNYFSEIVPVSSSMSEAWMEENLWTFLEGFVGEGLSSSSNFLLNLGLMIIYTFLLLLYRSALKRFFLMQVEDNKVEGVLKVLNDIQKLSRQYLFGLVLVILILSILNSMGLWLIGVSHPIFWGFLAAFLAIIPYVGTFLGGMLTVLFTYAETNTLWQPMAVIALFASVQFLEGNFITPKVVGDSVKINPLAAILSLVIGGAIWGVAGLVLAIPAIAVLRKIMMQVDFLKPLSLLLSSDLYHKDSLFEEKFNKERFQLRSFFKRRPPS